MEMVTVVVRLVEMIPRWERIVRSLRIGRVDGMIGDVIRTLVLRGMVMMRDQRSCIGLCITLLERGRFDVHEGSFCFGEIDREWLYARNETEDMILSCRSIQL